MSVGFYASETIVIVGLKGFFSKKVFLAKETFATKESS